MKSIIALGAEALIIKNKNIVIKKRIKKSYRFPNLDIKLRKQRTKRELKLLEKSFPLIPVPKIIKSSEYEITLEYIEGKKLSDNLDSLKNAARVSNLMGQNIANLHDSDIIHGDLTTSNMILKKNKVYFIDFGLGFISPKIEDKATDLHVLKEALEARHFTKAVKFWSEVLKGYKISKNYKETLKRLEAVEKRGRYKSQY